MGSTKKKATEKPAQGRAGVQGSSGGGPVWRGDEGLAALLVPVGELTPHPGNARRGDVGEIAKSLQANGQYRPIVVASDGIVVAGNHTWQAAVQLGWSHVAATPLDVPHDDPRAKRILLVDNRVNDMAGYDDQALADLLGEIAEREGATGLTGTGFDVGDLNSLLDGLTVDDDPADTEPADEGPVLGELEYRVVAVCRDEEQQAEVASLLEERGVECRLAMV